MKTVIPALVLAFAAGNVFAAAPTPFRATYEVTLSSEGRIVAMHIDERLAPGAQAALERTLRGWRFEPGTVAGVPAETRTFVRVAGDYLEVDGLTQVRVHSAQTGPALNRYAPPPLLHGERAQGLVVLRLELRANGTVRDVEVVHPVERDRDSTLAASAEATVRRWRFTPEQVGGESIAASVLVPICFARDQNLPESCRWSPPGSERPGFSEWLTLAPAARLDTETGVEIAGR